MAKYFVVLSLCSITAFVMVLRTRPDIFSSGGFLFRTPAATTPATPPPEKKDANPRTPATRSRRAVEQTPSPAPNEIPSVTDHLTQTTGRTLSRATIISDTVAVYATNSFASRIVKVLNRGDLVQTDLAVIDSTGYWRLVQLPEQRISGYVRSEDIEISRISLIEKR